MLNAPMVYRVTAAVTFLLLAGGSSRAKAVDIGWEEERVGHVLFDVIGQVNNSAAPAPLGSSTQFGYIAFAEGIDQVFATDDPANQNQSTALLTFVTNVQTTRVTVNGPLSIIVREGTTTIYRNSVPADFGVPSSFASGDVVVTASTRQQVIVDTVEKTFTVTNMNLVTGAARFEIDGHVVRLAHRGDVLRTSLVGVLTVRDGVPPPTGYFSGNVVAAARQVHPDR